MFKSTGKDGITIVFPGDFGGFYGPKIPIYNCAGSWALNDWIIKSDIYTGLVLNSFLFLQDPEFEVRFENLQFCSSPIALFARLLVLSSNPQVDSCLISSLLPI